ncbi:DExH-box ATP-dependent RNA helicase DExH8 isoform X2 [Jatropha curcas]|uniref:DExH-box ATP-dependent RNA helicase DExH8 isoform X2 n=1 Tax=Jatropha curcas TaxID=180498 RepID=UPI0009D6ECF7|nr:DExH-box ATP-dependent RNA helicase DExH8 isoform X2 [Jatropha curcas]
MDAPSSPTSSVSSTRSSPFIQPKFSSLPVISLREKIVEKIKENRVTLIVGEAGCGKSSQIPQFLLEENMEPILCTQPRRFAVVAVAKMVAQARNCELGGEVGYHIGHSKLLSARVVLMSATADFGRYRDFFKDLGRGERVEVLAIPSSNQQALFQRKVSYLEQITEFLGITSDLLATRYCSGPSPSMAAADIKEEVHKLIYDLIMHIHENEPDIEKSILVFLPTYRDLEQQWYLLKPLISCFKVHILHGSIETQQALMAMKIWKSHRKVILATNIAESSVTIPKVAYVIDSCRSLQVFWDTAKKMDSAELVWVSKSQANQRKGRTGRTCDGHIYRLVTGSFFNKLQEHESPAILKLSLRQQVLLICCAESKAINDPKVLLQKALDPPDPQVIEDALNLLVQINALARTSARGRYDPTFYGRLLASFSLSFDASVLLLKFGDIGLLREGILMGILMDLQPLPILHPFGEEPLFTQYACRYFGGDCNNIVKIGRKEMILIGNLNAYQFWQRVFKDKHRLEHLKGLSTFSEMKAASSLLPKIEEEWCLFHNLIQSSLHQVSDMYEDILNSLHQFRPRFLGKCDGLPTYYDPYEFGHVCFLQYQPDGDTVAVAADDEHNELSCETKKCCAVPFVSSVHFQTINVAQNFSAIVKEVRAQLTQDGTRNLGSYTYNDVSHVNENAPSCVYFLDGSCNKGSECRFSHSLDAKRPACNFFFSLQGCRNGESCHFSHDLGSSISSVNPIPCLPEDDDVNAATFLQLFPASSDGCILLLDDTDMHFSSILARHYDPSKIICTTCTSGSSIVDPSLRDVRVLWGLSHPYQTIISKAAKNPIPWSEIKCILWFPNLNSDAENLEKQKLHIQNFFEYLSIRIIADSLYELRVIITMNNIRFSLLQVEKLGRESFFFLRESFPFDEASLGELQDTTTTRKPVLASKAISYVFDFQPPTDIQFDDYAAALRKCLNDINGCT